MTRLELRDLALEYADAVGSPRWSTANINIAMGGVQWRNIARLLNANNQFYINTCTVTQNVNGQFNWSDLTTGSGDSAKNAYRVQSLGSPSSTSGGTSSPLFYREVKYVQYPNPQASTQLAYVWYRFGSVAQVLPASSGMALQAVVNYRPPRVDQLSADSITVEYPDGYETGLACETAAMMLMKGAAESGVAADLMAVANGIFEDMILDLGRMSISPTVAQAMDNASDWGG